MKNSMRVFQRTLPHPTLSQEERERLLTFPSPLGRRCPEGADEGPVFLWLRTGLLALLLLSSISASAAGKAGATGAAFLKIAAGARPAALGEAVTGTVDDVNAVAWNPAGLSGVTSPQFTAVQAQWLQEYDHAFVAAAYPFSWGVLGFGLTSLTVDGIEKRSSDVSAPEGTFGADDTLYNLSYGRGLGEAWAVGGGLSLIRQSLDGRSASAFAGNLGVQWRPEDRALSLGASLRHLGSEVKFDEEGDPLPTALSVGGGLKLMEGRVRLSADVRAPQEEDVSFGAGAEFRRRFGRESTAAFRLGYNTAAADASDGLSGVTGGLGLAWTHWGFDMAWAPYGALGHTFRYAVLVKF
jgi:hypothetical protein